ncbi:MAG: hypothetical protein MUC88_00170 [Planctomycetes bacterium]|jgi:hypothetical protein|nr:hypothetical protein [Planctomycetota bacterium]
MMKDKDPDRTNIGNVLLALGMINEAQLSEAIGQQRGDPDALLGRLLIAMGVISEADLETALSAQDGLRSRRRGPRVMAEAKIARHRVKRVMDIAGRVAERGHRVTQALSEKRRSGEFLSVAPFLEKGK